MSACVEYVCILSNSKTNCYQGKYTVEADVYTVNDVKITCLTAVVQFSRSGFFGSDL